MLGKGIIIYKNGSFVGVYKNLTQASVRSKLSISTISRLLLKGKESKKGYSFDNII